MKITEKEFNIQTGEETSTERDITEQEIAKRAELEMANLAAQAEAEAKAAEKDALLERLGISAEEAKLLLSQAKYRKDRIQ